jgi:copper chaperone NosL
MTNSPGISKASRVLCLLGVVALVISLFVPLWRIELDAPQYPEGLGLLIYPHKIGGDVDIINGLNHYIGMATLHSENFIEFTLLPYIIVFFALAVLAVAIVAKRRWLNVVFGAFTIFGILAMADFWRWEYNYGHNLDPNAAIIVPGMSYQPPLIGFKQLLNFGAFSIPDLGGWLFIACGLLLLTGVLIEAKFFERFKKQKASVAMLLLFMSSPIIQSCSVTEPEPIQINKDNCAFCKMTISDARFAAELITEKGRVYKYDDLLCMKHYLSENTQTPYRSIWVGNFNKPEELLNAEQAYYISSDQIKSPMRGDIAAFASVEEAEVLAKTYNTTISDWKMIKQK